MHALLGNTPVVLLVPVYKGEVNGSRDIGGGEYDDIGVSLDLVNLCEESIHHTDGI